MDKLQKCKAKPESVSMSTAIKANSPNKASQSSPSKAGNTEIEPKFEIDVNIEGKELEKCVIYEGETADQVADRIVKKHQLTEEDKQVILQQLQQSMMNKSP